MFVFPFETSMYFCTGFCLTPSTGCRVCLLFSYDIDDLVIGGAEETTDILDGDCVG